MIGKTVLHYQIIKEIGRDGMGSVYLAEDARLERQVAIKFLPTEITGDDNARERFLKEAKTAIALSHPNIAQLYAVEASGDATVAVMEYIPGRDLKTIISEANNRLDDGETNPAESLETYLSIPEVVDIVSEVADALQYAHDRGIVHRKVTSANIMISEDGEVKLMDFGLTAEVPPEGERKMEDLTYMAPEQIRGQKGTARSDIWAIGIVLYELLTGELPFRGARAQALQNSILNDAPILPSEFDNAIPDEFDEIVAATLNKDAALRYASVTDFKTALNDKVEALPAFQFLKKNSTVSMKALLLPLIIILLLLAVLYFVTQSG